MWNYRKKYIFLCFILEKYSVSTFDVIIAIFKQQYTNDEFLAEALRILKLDGTFFIYEPLPTVRKSDMTLTYPERISRLKLSGFMVKDLERKSLDTDLESKNLLAKVYGNIDDVCKVLASKPPFEVNLIFLSIYLSY